MVSAIEALDKSLKWKDAWNAEYLVTLTVLGWTLLSGPDDPLPRFHGELWLVDTGPSGRFMLASGTQNIMRVDDGVADTLANRILNATFFSVPADIIGKLREREETT